MTEYLSRREPVLKIVVTGANSYLGSAFVRSLESEGGHQVTALVSPRANLPAARAGVRYLKADLTQPLSEEAWSEVQSADFLFHFAWSRGKDFESVWRQNEQMILHLMGAFRNPGRFYFISSVAAGPQALSVYGTTKYRATRLVSERGGVSLVCGLVTDEPPRGSYKMLRSLVAKLPISLRFTGEVPEIYPISLPELLRDLQRLSEKGSEPGTYRLFRDPVDLNAFLKGLESEKPRFRFPVRINPACLLRLAAFLRKCHLLPVSLAEKFQTFLYKDPLFLKNCSPLP